jgi:hypothetical protein
MATSRSAIELQEELKQLHDNFEETLFKMSEMLEKKLEDPDALARRCGILAPSTYESIQERLSDIANIVGRRMHAEIERAGHSSNSRDNLAKMTHNVFKLCHDLSQEKDYDYKREEIKKPLAELYKLSQKLDEDSKLLIGLESEFYRMINKVCELENKIHDMKVQSNREMSADLKKTLPEGKSWEDVDGVMSHLGNIKDILCSERITSQMKDQVNRELEAFNKKMTEIREGNPFVPPPSPKALSFWHDVRDQGIKEKTPFWEALREAEELSKLIASLGLDVFTTSAFSSKENTAAFFSKSADGKESSADQDVDRTPAPRLQRGASHSDG